MNLDSDSIDLDEARRPELFESVPARRVVAFFVDAILIGLLMIPGALVLFVIAVATLGIGILLFPALFAIVALTYVALTLGGPNSATPGMRLVGIEARTGAGRPMFPLLAAMHALLFWASVSLLTPLVLLLALLTPRKRLLHDIILDVVVVNRNALPD